MTLLIVILTVCAIMYMVGESQKQKTINLKMEEIDVMDGHDFEYYTAEMLKYDGFKSVEVTKGSGDFGVDVTAYKDGHKWAFQCKRYSKNLGLKPIQEVYAGAKRYNADKAVVFTNVYFTPNAQSLANTLHVELWGRDKLSDMIWQRKQEEEARKEFRKAVIHGNCKKKEPKQQPITVKKPAKESVAVKELPKVQEQDVEPPKPKKPTDQQQPIVIEPEARQEPKLENELMQMLYPVKPKELEKHKEEKIEVKDVATVIGAGKYVFGQNIPMGQYDLKAISGRGRLRIQIGDGDDFDDRWQNIGVNTKDFADSYNGLTLPKGWFFAIDGDVKCEITKSKMLEIE